MFGRYLKKTKRFWHAISPDSSFNLFKKRVKGHGDSSGQLLQRRIWLVCIMALLLTVLQTFRSTLTSNSNWELVSPCTFHFQTHCWSYLPYTVLRAEVILESYAEVYSNQFTTGNSPFQLVQCSTVPNMKKKNRIWYSSLITRNSLHTRQPLSRVNVTGLLCRLQVKIENIYLFKIIIK